jgi:hypothetical protein
MNRQKTISYRLLLAGIVLGLNALCFLGISHGRHVARHTGVDYSHIPAHASGRSSRGGRSGLIATVDWHLDHSVVDHIPQARLVKGAISGPATVAPAIRPAALVLPKPDDSVELLLVRENVVALGSAPRAPDRGRAPPAV